MPMLSVVIPVYNERGLWAQVVARVEAAALPEGLARQIVLVDDGSTDGTAEELRQAAGGRPEWVVRLHERNRGKGAALHTGFAAATGEFVLVQDADWEYDPRDYGKLLAPLLDGRADAVFGSRFLGEPHRVLYYWHYLGNRLLTTLSNVCTNLNLTDMECCYKVFRREVLGRVKLVEARFGFEPEVTAKLARMGARIFEVPVSYAGRTYAEGKKARWRDGVSAVRCIFRYGVWERVERWVRRKKFEEGK